MSKATTFRRVEAEITAGDLGKARDRLEGLLVTYPEDLEIRRRLGEVYLTLQYPERAGKFLYLEDDHRPAVAKAKDIFEGSHHRDPLLVLYALNYRGGLEAIAGTHAEAVLRRLLDDARIAQDKYEWYVGPKRADGQPPVTFNERAATFGCGAGFLVLLVLIFIGAATVIGWALALLK